MTGPIIVLSIGTAVVVWQTFHLLVMLRFDYVLKKMRPEWRCLSPNFTTMLVWGDGCDFVIKLKMLHIPIFNVQQYVEGVVFEIEMTK